MSRNTARIKKISKNREKKIANEIDGERHIFSGGLWWKKGDASDLDFLIEDKFTESAFYLITKKTLNKIEKEALGISKLPVLRVGFLRERKSEDYVILRKKDCIVESSSPTETGEGSKSYRLTSEHAKDLYISGDVIMLTILIDSIPYVVMGWSEFLECKDKILAGIPL